MSNREGDIFEVLKKLPSEENKAYWVIRCNHDRSILNESTQKFELRLRETVSQSLPIGQFEFEMPAGTPYRNCKKKNTRTERTVKQEIRACTISLRSAVRKEKNLKSLKIYLVHCKEIETPPGEECIEWFLITSYPIANAETAVEIVNWYLCRWLIESFIKCISSNLT